MVGTSFESSGSIVAVNSISSSDTGVIMEGFQTGGGSKSPKMTKKMVLFDVCDKTSVR